MSDQQKKSTEGPPIWVESLLSTKEYAECAKKYPSTYRSKIPRSYDPSYHKGGRWRYKMGSTYTPQELEIIWRESEKLYKKLREDYVLRNSGELVS